MIRDTLIRSAHPGDAEAIARIYVDTWRSTYRNILPQGYLEGMRYDRAALSIQQGLIDPQNHFLVAEEAQGAVGYIAGGVERTQDPVYGGEVYEFYLLPAFQRRGLGRRLLSALAHQLENRSLHSMMVWVLAANPNRRFYEKTGGLYIRTRSISFAGLNLMADAYGWIDITLAMNDRP
ncbi:MAG: GNAT family N-acetyltransferase [Desulfobacteraceae bacterium]|nr:MAG: GNAT family N-acetyltransferase [Desulfobacteraceae bacterium]